MTGGTTTFGLYPDGTANITLNIPIGSYELDGFERAIARQAKANTTLWAAVTKAQAHGTVNFGKSGLTLVPIQTTHASSGR